MKKYIILLNLLLIGFPSLKAAEMRRAPSDSQLSNDIELTTFKDYSKPAKIHNKKMLRLKEEFINKNVTVQRENAVRFGYIVTRQDAINCLNRKIRTDMIRMRDEQRDSFPGAPNLLILVNNDKGNLKNEDLAEYVSDFDKALKEGDNINASTANGVTLLMYAAATGKKLSLEHLLNKGADPALTDILGRTYKAYLK